MPKIEPLFTTAEELAPFNENQLFLIQAVPRSTEGTDPECPPAVFFVTAPTSAGAIRKILQWFQSVMSNVVAVEVLELSVKGGPNHGSVCLG